jgi:hypothetical protein
MTVWKFQEALARRLFLWGGLSLLAGALLALSQSGFWRGVRIQAAGWGAVDAGVATVGLRAARVRQEGGADQAAEIKGPLSLRRWLFVNTGPDVIYVMGGAWLAAVKGKQNDSWRWHGVGIVLPYAPTHRAPAGAAVARLLSDIVHAA